MATVILTPGERLTLAGNVSVTGTTSGAETIEVVGPTNIELDASFNRGGDTLILPGHSSGYTAQVVASRVIISGEGVLASIPIGTEGMVIQFADTSMVLVYDADTETVMLGSQALDGDAQPIEVDTNQAPQAVDDSNSNADDPADPVVTGNVLSNDSDEDGDQLSVLAVNGETDAVGVELQGEFGTITINEDGSYTYTLETYLSDEQTETFTYSVSDGNGGTSEAELVIALEPYNQRPVTQSDSYTAEEDGSLVVSAVRGVLSNDFDSDGDELTAVLESGPSHGSLTLNPDGSFTYTPNDGFSGTDSFVYRANDGTASGYPATVTINVVGETGDGEHLDGNFTAAYMSGPDDPWGNHENDQDMDNAFGEGNWTRYTEFDASAIGEYDFLYLDGSDDNFSELVDFINANRDALEDYVADGGTLFINAARNELDELEFDLGFGVTLIDDSASTVHAVDPDHPIIDGPNGDAGTTFTGRSFSHDILSGEGLTALLESSDGDTVLAEMAWGAGHVIFGGLTTENFQYPDPQSGYLRANILDYAASFSDDYAVPVL